MLLLEKKTKYYHLGIWKIEETKEEFLSLFQTKDKIEPSIKDITSPSKILERLAVRVLLRLMLKKKQDILYLKSGKPYLMNSNLNISISHTKGYVAVLLGNSKYLGMDIQYITPKIKNIKDKFISENEYINTSKELIHLLLHWCAKETLYKAMGKGLDLKNSFRIEHFEPKEQGMFKAYELMSEQPLSFNIEYSVTPEYVLTYTHQNIITDI